MDFEAFFKTNQKMIYRMIYNYVKRKDLSEDLVIEVFMKVYQKWGKVKDFENPIGYLVRIAINRAKKEVMKKKVMEFLPFESEMVSLRDHPEEKMLVKEENSHLERLLDSLKVQEKEVILLKDLDGLKFSDIAMALKMKLPTVKSHYRRGKEKMVKMMEAIPP